MRTLRTRFPVVAFGVGLAWAITAPAGVVSALISCQPEVELTLSPAPAEVVRDSSAAPMTGAQSTNLQVNNSDGGLSHTTAEGGETNIPILCGTPGAILTSSSTIKISGTVTDPDGRPAPEVRVRLLPSFSAAEQQTDAEGHFVLSFDPRQGGSAASAGPIVIARDPRRNLAAALELEEGATNASVRLGPALTLAGRILDPDGKPLTNAQAQLWFCTERVVIDLGARVRSDAEGRFEITALPAGRQYSINVSAKGFGKESRPVPGTAAAINCLQLGTFTLVRADLRIAGVVLDEDDKPVTRASIYTFGDGQPNLIAQTDAKGQFSLDKVCPGPIQVSANARGGAYGNATTEGGDTNITIRIGARPGVRMSAPPTASLKGRPMPDLAPLGLTQAELPAGRPLLVVLVDAEQRPSRRTLRLLSEQATVIKEKGVTVVVVHTGTMSDEDFKAWKQESALPFPVGCLKGESAKARAAWGASALPWLILTDKAHSVVADGFMLEELDAKIEALAK